MTFEAAFVVLLGAIVVARIISQRSLKQLSPEQKVALMDSFGSYNAFGLIPVVVIVAVYFILESYTQLSSLGLLAGYILAVFGFLVWSFLFTRRKLRALSLPASYMSAFGLASAIRYIGLALFLAIVVLNGG